MIILYYFEYKIIIVINIFYLSPDISRYGYSPLPKYLSAEDIGENLKTNNFFADW